MGNCCLGRENATSQDNGELPSAIDSRYRAARSVHLWWKPSGEGDIVAFYNEVRVTQSTPGSYFMVCGFDGGYFGIQEMPDLSHRVLFSVWDASSEMYQGKDDPRLVPLDDRVQILNQASDVLVQRFGGEGTGAQCLDDATGWQKRNVVACLVECRKSPSGRACYSAFVRNRPDAPWKHLATYRVACGKRFQGFYSFIEDFRRDYNSTMCLRKADFGPAWFRTVSGEWLPAVEAGFTASGASWERPDNIDTCEGDADGLRTLATGGNDLAGAHKLKSNFKLCPGHDGPPGAAPCADFPPEDIQDLTPLPCVEAQGPACPLCGGGLGVGGGRGPFCGGETCEPLQCAHVDRERCVWPRSQGGKSEYCRFHASNGKDCPLCLGTVAGSGPYCAGDCCGSAQCQGKSPFATSGRCPFPCSGGAMCGLHR
eukprot:TRINITY_DN73498_c0_g1_i1.p1 TRINITY_DN73498_c0_g1~~TRINITY_DN73498_c0_g1_i1.p1  ORF type:complete len:426 (-),score=41.44 TRINITY_DN73498_c0_g1_i1:94-1371(-)